VTVGGGVTLPEDLELLRELALRQHQELCQKREALSEQARQLDAQAEQIRWLEEYVRLLKHQRFGRRSEKSSDEQLRIFNEAEAALDAEAKAPEEEASPGIEVAAHTRQPHGRKPLPAWIPRREVLHDLPEEKKRCEADGTPLGAWPRPRSWPMWRSRSMPMHCPSIGRRRSSKVRLATSLARKPSLASIMRMA